MKDEELIVLLDKEGYVKPTRDNILAILNRISETADRGAEILIHYSGHGNRFISQNRPVDTIVPVDYETAGQITDEEMANAVTKKVGNDVRLTALMDCCHSASILMLPYLMTEDGSVGMTGVKSLVRMKSRFIKKK